MQRHVYQRQIHSAYELRRRLIDVWCGLEQTIFDEAVDSGEVDIERVSAPKEDTSSIACELTMLILSISVTFIVTCLIGCIFNYEIMPATLANTFLFIYKVMYYQIWGLVVYFTWSQLISVCNNERIIKIGQYLSKLCSNE